MQFWFLMLGALLALVGAAFHGIVGQQKYMTNIYASDLPSLSKSLSLVSWHVFTIFLVITAFTLIYVAYVPNLKNLLIPIVIINFLGACLFVFLGFRKHKVLLSMPGGYLMGGTAFLGLLGINDF
jgi:uncharacterized BrkB/YihY/UPF0761 family membrane protein|tara:strand:+ start:1191 stop:1565 length:375 start_codon:yes stop_codon:yes gene_type:complete